VVNYSLTPAANVRHNGVCGAVWLGGALAGELALPTEKRSLVMHIPPRSLPGLAAGALFLLVGLPLSGVHAQGSASKEGAQVIITLTDGTILQGMDRREGKYNIEGQEVIFVPSGFFFLDDGPRRVFFGSKLLRNVKPRPETTEEKVQRNRDIRIQPETVPQVDEVLSVGSFNEKWDRTVKFRSGLHGKKVEQHLTVLTPYYARTDATARYIWPAVYLTRELGPGVVRELLSSHPDFEEDRKLSADALVARRFRYCDFFAQAGWYDEAGSELGRLLADKPSDKDKARAEAAIATLGKMRCREQFEAIKQAHNAGQFQAVRKRLADFNEKAAGDDTLTALRTMRDEYQAADKALADAARFLDDLSAKLSHNGRDAALVEAATTLRAGLQPDDLPRLEAFLGQAAQAERQGKAGGKATGPAELLSLAITGWMLGNPSAEAKPETAVRIWRARQFTMKYLSSDERGWKLLLDSYLRDSENAATVDEFTQFIPRLPPPEPEEKITDQPVEMKSGAGRDAASYLLQLPPEYRPGRNWPVLIVLHQSGETPADMLKRWSEAAGDNGYILVAPEWGQGLGGAYGYSDREHAVVLETLRDLRRRFAVDSDRVFLFGLGQGGEMAFDMGLSHPDLFAGVLPMSAGPRLFARKYVTNGQYLPFYIVDGDRSGNEIKKNLRDEFSDWVSQYPMMWIQYKGRGVEWYGGEVPMMFDWMRNKKREFPLQQIGVGVAGAGMNKDLVTQRATDNSFYWLTTEGIKPRYINSETAWRNNVPSATLRARIILDDGAISVETVGLSNVTLWLGRNGNGESMIDFDKPLTVRWNKDSVLSTPWNKKKVTPSLETLLEDLARRGDRQRLFVAKLEF
jgi:pimeloyl-ACP methyl ester carboxylesterase